jgi:ferric-dicitrate binding protein FerR (iron transport regulator)
MSTSDARTASPSPLSLAGFLVDEAALKRAFDSEFPSCLASAKTQLGDASYLAPRVVETAFLNAWAQRATLGGIDHLKSVLADEIRHGTARALSRRHSGGRFGAVSGAKTGEHKVVAEHESAAYVWGEIEKAMHGSGHNAEAHAAAAATGRREAVSHMKAMGKRPGWLIPVVIGVVALVVSIAGMIYVDRLGEDDAALSLVASTQSQPIAAAAGQIGSAPLRDGTKMRLGPESKIYIADGFSTKNRVLKVEGTAQFDVAKNQALPFHVVAHRMHFIATGTKFTISTFSPDSMPAVQVEEGSVTIKAPVGTAVVNAGQTMVVEKSGIRAATDEEKAERFGWTNNEITVRNKQLRVAVEALTRWFNYDVKVPDTKLLDRPTSFDVPLDSSRLAISQVEKSANVKFDYEGESKVFRDAGAAPAKADAKPAGKSAAKAAAKTTKKKKK